MVHLGDKEGINTASSRAVWGPGKFRMRNISELSFNPRHD
jgi:hypothetical protein